MKRKEKIRESQQLQRHYTFTEVIVTKIIEVRKAQRSYLTEWSLQGSETKNTPQKRQNRNNDWDVKLLVCSGCYDSRSCIWTHKLDWCIVSCLPNLQAISVGYASLGIPSSALKYEMDEEVPYLK